MVVVARLSVQQRWEIPAGFNGRPSVSADFAGMTLFQEFAFCLKPVTQLGSRSIAARQVDFVGALLDLLGRRRRFWSLNG